LYTIFQKNIKEYLYLDTYNIGENESYLRIIISIILLLIAFINGWMMLMMISLMLFYTGISKNCFIYTIFDINKKLTLETLYFRYLPKYNPEPILVLDNKSNTVFKNGPAKEKLNIDNFQIILGSINPEKIISDEKTISLQYASEEERTYLINFKGVKSINYILVYATDITSALEAEQEVINTQKDVVYAMGAIGETRSKETGNHVKRVALYSEILALKYGLSKEEAELLKLASPMHDIGKVGIKDEILNKPGKLTQEEFKIMKTHSTLGFNMLKNSDKLILKTAAIVAHEHHEKWDGSGYPKKLKGEDIHIYGRITAVADVFDALGSSRVYKEAWELDKIFELFKEERGKHFEPKLVDIFFEHFDELNKIRLKYKDK
jgi:response regulator RpfG family c-di-GMP phosphodiesterase